MHSQATPCCPWSLATCVLMSARIVSSVSLPRGEHSPQRIPSRLEVPVCVNCADNLSFVIALYCKSYYFDGFVSSFVVRWRKSGVQLVWRVVDRRLKFADRSERRSGRAIFAVNIPWGILDGRCKSSLGVRRESRFHFDAALASRVVCFCLHGTTKFKKRRSTRRTNSAFLLNRCG